MFTKNLIIILVSVMTLTFGVSTSFAQTEVQKASVTVQNGCGTAVNCCGDECSKEKCICTDCCKEGGKCEAECECCKGCAEGKCCADKAKCGEQNKQKTEGIFKSQMMKGNCGGCK